MAVMKGVRTGNGADYSGIRGAGVADRGGQMADTETIAGLKSLGPASQAMLARAGILTVADLRALCAVAAYVRVKQADGRASLNLLWALESALTGVPWQVVARERRLSLLLAMEEAETGCS